MVNETISIADNTPRYAAGRVIRRRWAIAGAIATEATTATTSPINRSRSKKTRIARLMCPESYGSARSRDVTLESTFPSASPIAYVPISSR
jgi:hypothetical protein